MIGDLGANDVGTRINTDACTKFQISKIEELNNVGCTHTSGQTCVAQIQLEADYINNEGDVTYLWTTDIGTITNGDTHKQVLILVTADIETQIEVTCDVQDGLGQTSSATASFITLHEEVA